MLTNQKKIQHLYLRAGFMPKASVMQSLANSSIQDAVKQLFTDSNSIASLQSGDESEISVKEKDLSEAERKEFRMKRAMGVRRLNEEWMNQLISTDAVLREKMTLFWHGHFACRSPFGFYARGLNNAMRENALGNFGDLLKAVSKSPAMLAFLNNQQNRKQSPNENFAREVMELFTLGRGNYTEDDIKNAARAFTGWRFKLNGDFDFKEEQHDEGVKTFLGKTGNFNGDDILNIILQDPEVSRYITKKVYRYFVNEEVDENICAELAQSFAKDYDIGKLMNKILTSDWFYDEKNVGTKIKSPVELIVNMQRAVPVKFKIPDVVLYAQKVLGEVLFMPPNVAGWPGGRDWIDSSTLMFRLAIPGFVYNQAEVFIRPKENPDEAEHRMMQDEEMQEERQQKMMGRLEASVDWASFIGAFANVDDTKLYNAITEYLIQTPSPEFKQDVISKYIVKDTRETFVRSLTTTLMSVPEYQMC
ncbi:MAG TPA: DUF1800 domain-containing protein [Bacteroidia bacterium]|nr:DUF1800 domain-containing protein [Bacteroidia bacterium]